jgi:uncharacterized protein DUF3667
VSHSKERSEKNCLNCGEIVQGRYCQACGQENIEPKESAWGLISHFFQDITHFDGKFFSTGKLLFTRPGYLPKEYISGRRQRYLHPIRMYVFTSALFFLIFYSLFNVNDWGIGKTRKDKAQLANLNAAKVAALKDADNEEDSAAIEKTFNNLSRIPIPMRIDIDTAKAGKKRRTGVDGPEDFGFLNISKSFYDAYDSRAEYDSVEASLPPEARDGWLQRRMEYRNIDLKKKYGDDEATLMRDLIDKFMHTFPYLLFLSLPLYALFLKLLYVRRKQFYYVDHALFLIYLYIFTFLHLLIFFGLQKIKSAVDHWSISLLIFLFVLSGIYYAYKAMRNFYGQGRWKTILKFLLLNFISSISIIFLFVLFFFFALLRV